MKLTTSTIKTIAPAGKTDHTFLTMTSADSVCGSGRAARALSSCSTTTPDGRAA